MTYSAARRKLLRKKGTYELVGCDILVGNDYQPYLLEVNTNPALFTSTQVQKDLIPPLVRASIKFALRLFESTDNQAEAIIEAEKSGF